MGQVRIDYDGVRFKENVNVFFFVLFEILFEKSQNYYKYDRFNGHGLIRY